MKISFEVDIKKYRVAVAEGWKERFGEDINPEEITLTNALEDIRHALSQLEEDDVENVQMEE